MTLTLLYHIDKFITFITLTLLLSKARSHTSTRSRFKLLPSKTAAYRNSVLPSLSRLLVDRNAELNYYIQELS